MNLSRGLSLTGAVAARRGDSARRREEHVETDPDRANRAGSRDGAGKEDHEDKPISRDTDHAALRFAGAGDDYVELNQTFTPTHSEIWGGGGDDILRVFFLRGHTTLSGGSGDDLLYFAGRTGVLIGGEGSDVFDVSGHVEIRDFQDGVQDQESDFRRC